MMRDREEGDSLVERRNVLILNFFEYEKHFSVVFSIQMSIEMASYS